MQKWRNATVLSFLKSQSIDDHQQRRWNIDDHQRRTNMFYMEGRRLLCPLGLQRLQNDMKSRMMRNQEWCEIKNDVKSRMMRNQEWCEIKTQLFLTNMKERGLSKQAKSWVWHLLQHPPHHLFNRHYYLLFSFFSFFPLFFSQYWIIIIHFFFFSLFPLFFSYNIWFSSSLLMYTVSKIKG